MLEKQLKSSTTVSQSQGNYRKSWKKKPKIDPEAEKVRKRDRAFIKRFNIHSQTTVTSPVSVGTLKTTVCGGCPTQSTGEATCSA